MVSSLLLSSRMSLVVKTGCCVLCIPRSLARPLFPSDVMVVHVAKLALASRWKRGRPSTILPSVSKLTDNRVPGYRTIRNWKVDRTCCSCRIGTRLSFGAARIQGRRSIRKNRDSASRSPALEHQTYHKKSFPCMYHLNIRRA